MINLEEVLDLAKQLSLSDQLRLIEQLAPEIERNLPRTNAVTRRSLWGICADLGNALSAEEIDADRLDMWC